ncbi:hypothetical protein FHX42_000304 [Saccharopolyspora lacisalsi]|uniref:DUF3107 domain-containing protein n=1 Tax=Halosaccharopolyspora lacisalsi TaxID=1000566 RepID=A0A839DUL9_9PSEU|nr:DUF3107 domain-containing protein [Halosaccharopolyspora lacisalsi]MBA8822975.1 hypothetical protein [Halosaccharopolyspora lacisalsi]
MEVKIGIADNSRELTIASGQSQDEVESLVTDALGKSEGQLALTDEKGRRYVVPSAKIAYVEIGASSAPRVGFGVS